MATAFLPVAAPAISHPSPLEPSHRQRESPPPAAATATAPIEVGTLVSVEARTWPGINKHGGIGKVTNLCYEEKILISVDVKYVLGGTEKQVEMEYVTCHSFQQQGREEENNLGGAGAGRSSRRKRKVPTVPVLEKPKSNKKSVRKSKRGGERSLAAKSKPVSTKSKSKPVKKIPSTAVAQKSIIKSQTKPHERSLASLFKPQKKAVEKQMQGLTLKPKKAQGVPPPSTKKISKPIAKASASTTNLTAQTFSQTPHASKSTNKPNHAVNTKVSAVTPGSSGKKSHATSTSTKLHTDIDVADLLATTGAAGTQKQLQRNAQAISKVSASATNSKYTSATTLLSSSSNGKKEQGTSSLATVFHTMTGQATEYVQNMVGKTSKPVRVSHVEEKPCLNQEVVASPSSSSSCSLSFQYEKSRFSRFQSLASTILRGSDVDCIQVNDLIQRVNGIRRDGDEEKSFTNMESRIYLKELEKENFIMVTEDDNLYKI